MEAQKLMRERQQLEDGINGIRRLETQLSDNLELIELGEAEDDKEIVSEAEAALKAELDEGLEGLSLKECRKRLQRIERTLQQLATGNKLSGAVHDDAMTLKYLHQRYSNYQRWLTSQS